MSEQPGIIRNGLGLRLGTINNLYILPLFIRLGTIDYSSNSIINLSYLLDYSSNFVVTPRWQSGQTFVTTPYS